MKSKFDKIFAESYKVLFLEEAPESTAKVKDVPDVNPKGEQEEMPDQETFTDGDSELPDPKQLETVSIDLLNVFIDFLKLSDDEQQKALKDYDFTKERANSDNYEKILDALKSVTSPNSPIDFPSRSI